MKMTFGRKDTTTGIASRKGDTVDGTNESSRSSKVCEIHQSQIRQESIEVFGRKERSERMRENNENRANVKSSQLVELR